MGNQRCRSQCAAAIVMWSTESGIERWPLLIGFLAVSAPTLRVPQRMCYMRSGVAARHRGVVVRSGCLVWLVRPVRQSEPLLAPELFFSSRAIQGCTDLYRSAAFRLDFVYVHLALSFLGAGLIVAARTGCCPAMPSFASRRCSPCWRCSRRCRYLRETRWSAWTH